MDLKNTKEPKKRGRKPKLVKVNNMDGNETETPIDPPVKILKKRGRKAKISKELLIESNSENNIKVHKKRGRKPKLSANKDIKIAENISNIILHLPIKNIDDTITPKPYDIVNSYTEFLHKKEPVNNENIIDFNKYIKYREEIFNNKNILFYEYVYSNKKNIWPEKTNIDCLWDSYPFENTPFGIPIKKDNNKIYLFGNFCSPECAAAYCINSNDDVWERYSLLNELYGKDMPLKIANSKLLLKKFGGIYTIEEYRNLNINNSKSYSICLPPVISYIPLLEETIIDINENMLVSKVNIKKINNYKLQRSKPLNDKNTLENIMNLKYL
jgi:hypothetical protein